MDWLDQADDFFKSDAVNPDRQILNSDVGFLEMMRFKGNEDSVTRTLKTGRFRPVILSLNT